MFLGDGVGFTVFYVVLNRCSRHETEGTKVKVQAAGQRDTIGFMVFLYPMMGLIQSPEVLYKGKMRSCMMR